MPGSSTKTAERGSFGRQLVVLAARFDELVAIGPAAAHVSLMHSATGQSVRIALGGLMQKCHDEG